jgi:excinuclease ABC subunit B
MYADRITGSMQGAIQETNRRRAIQVQYNADHGITPTSIQKAVRDVIEATRAAEKGETYRVSSEKVKSMDRRERQELVAHLEKEMKDAARQLQFERAAELRDIIFDLRQKM